MEKFRHAMAWLVVFAGCIGSFANATGPSGMPQQDGGSNGETKADAKKVKKMEGVTVTGSLIPRSEIETATPIFTITAKDMKARGFSSVADALQQSSFATGGVPASQSTGSFTPGAKTLSMFGLPVSFVKYLIDGRPMGDFPGLYGGSQSFNDISGIPMDLVDHIDILPGGQSSLYGSDAIAGVINIVLKKEISAPMFDARYGWTTGGGNASRSVSFVHDYRKDRFHLLMGIQWASTQPMWASDRSVADHYFTQGTSPPVARTDFLISRADSSSYYFRDPDQCAGVSGLFDGNEGKQTRLGSGAYCGAMRRPSYGTSISGQKSVEVYSHATWDAGDHLQLYGDLLYSHGDQRYSSGLQSWSTRQSALTYYDPNIGGSVDLQRNFAPEETGGYSHIMTRQRTRSTMANLGGHGSMGGSNWDYDLGVSHAEQHLEDRQLFELRDPIDSYFKSHILGPQQGWHGKVPIYTPSYSAFYQPVPVADFRSFTTFVGTRSKTWSNLLRGQLTNGTLFSTPSGDAGVAVALEDANEGWNKVPDVRYRNGSIYGTSAVQGAGHRSRYAATTEFRIPLLQRLTADVSGRWDDYKVSGEHIHHGTYTFGLEYRPLDSLLLRARYGTAFKAPSLADEFQGASSDYTSVHDYLNCARLGYSVSQIAYCPRQYERAIKTSAAGNANLQPITAKVWSVGAVWAPVERMSVSLDYLHWDIDNEVAKESAASLSLDQYRCDTGALSPTSATCVQTARKITRSPSTDPKLLGDITDVLASKVNVSNEQVNAVTANFNYTFTLERLGDLSVGASYSNVLKHLKQPYPTDSPMDLYAHPGKAHDFKSKLNGSITWSPDPQWSTTLSFNRSGAQPNYLARQNDSLSARGSGRLPAWILYSASARYRPMENLSLSFEVSNLFNRMPPLDRSYPGTFFDAYDSSAYDSLGRAMYVEATYSFGKHR